MVGIQHSHAVYVAGMKLVVHYNYPAKDYTEDIPIGPNLELRTISVTLLLGPYFRHSFTLRLLYDTYFM